MNQQIKISQSIQYLIIGLGLITFLLIWPTGIIHKTMVSKSGEIVARESDPISVKNNATQMFVAEGENLSAVDLFVCNDMQGETITFRLYDASYSELFNKFYVVKSRTNLPGFVHIPVDYDLVKDQEYYYTLEGLSTDLFVNYEDTYESSSIVNGILAYGGDEVPGYNIIIRYEYTDMFSMVETILFLIGIIILVSGLCFFIRILFKKKLRDRDIKVQKVFQFIGNPLIIGVTILCLYGVFPGRMFETGILNYAFYYSSILLLATFLLYGINHKRTIKEPLMTFQYVKEHWTDYIQVLMFAGIFYGCCQYMNALYDIFQYKAVCNIIVFISLSEIVKYSKKEIFNWVNLIYLVVIGVLLFFFYQPGKWTTEDPTIIQKELLVIVVFGFTLVNTFVILIKKQFGKPKLPYAVVTLVFLTLLVIFRNTRSWPIFALIMFSIFYIRYSVWDKKDRYLINFSNGILIHFAYGLIFCLLYRPYHIFCYYRYPLFFHTVTVTAYYLCLILAVALVKFLAKYAKEKSLKACYKELFILGVVEAYLFMTLTRTGYIAAIVLVPVTIVLFVVFYEKKKLLGILKGIGVSIAVMCLAFPVCFTVTRTIPAVVNEPYMFETEPFVGSIQKGFDTNSDYYMYLGRFFEMTGYRLFGYHADRFENQSRNDDMLYPLEQTILLASMDDGQAAQAAEEISKEQEAGISNGRFDIFKAYIDEWNLWGHDTMGATLPNGEISVHAHNIYLQVIHDHGLVVGIIFPIFGIITFITSIKYYIANHEKNIYTLLPTAIFIAFAVSGLTEWVFHPCNPLGCAVFMVLAPLLFNVKKEKNEG